MKINQINMSDQESTKKIATKVAKARGFNSGEFEIVHNTNKAEFKDSIQHKIVKGVFEIDTSDDPIIVKKQYFTQEAWVALCSCMGFSFYNCSDIEAFVIKDGTLSAYVAIDTDTLPNI